MISRRRSVKPRRVVADRRASAVLEVPSRGAPETARGCSCRDGAEAPAGRARARRGGAGTSAGAQARHRGGLRGRRGHARAPLRPPGRRSLQPATRAHRRGRAPSLPVQGPRPPAPRPPPARRMRPRRPAGDPVLGGCDRALRPASAGDRPQRPRHRGRPPSRAQGGRRRLRPQAVRLQRVSARIASVLRRRDARRLGPRRVGELHIDTATREVRVGERSVRLAGKEYALLCALAAEPRRVFTKQELLRDVWGYRAFGNAQPSTPTRAACAASSIRRPGGTS